MAALDAGIRSLVGNVETALIHVRAAATAVNMRCTMEFGNMQVTAYPAAEGKPEEVVYMGEELLMQDQWFLPGLAQGLGMDIKVSFTKNETSEFVVKQGDSDDAIRSRYRDTLKTMSPQQRRP